MNKMLDFPKLPKVCEVHNYENELKLEQLKNSIQIAKNTKKSIFKDLCLIIISSLIGFFLPKLINLLF